MAKSFKRFLPLFIVVTSGVIFLGDVPHKILPPVQAQVQNFSPEQVNKLARNATEEIEILSGVVTKGRLAIREGTEIIFRCIRDGYEVPPPLNPNAGEQRIRKTLGHVVEVFDYYTKKTIRSINLYYNDPEPRPIVLPRGTYGYKIDGKGSKDYKIEVKKS